MPLENEEVTVKRLPGGPECRAVVRSLNGRRLELDARTTGTSAWPRGSLVEITSTSNLYLGEVKGCHDDVVVINIEHAVNQDALAKIAQVWQKNA